MGWDDNGLPTERRVQNHYGVRCDPSVAYDPGFEPPAQPSDEEPRRGLAPQLRRAVPAADRGGRARLRRAVAHARAVGRLVDDLHDDRPAARSASRSARSSGCSSAAQAYQLEAPTLWDVDFQTAVAQAELEDRERPGAMHRVRFGTERRRHGALIDTTRPELIAACVALLAHPDDERHARARRRRARTTPLFGTTRAGPQPPAGRARQGHGPRDGVHLRRPHRRDLVARAGPAGPLGPRPGRAAACEVPWGSRGLGVRRTSSGARASYAELAGRTSQPGAAADRRAAARSPAIWSASRSR